MMKTQKNVLFVIGIITCFLVSLELPAADFYVNNITGNDSNDGSEASPWKTIQYSADNVSPGSTVHISAGIYCERVVISVSGNATDGYITFLGDSAGGTIIDGSGFTSENMESFNRPELDSFGLGNASALIEIIDRSYLQIENIEIRNYVCCSINIFPMGLMVLKTDAASTVMRDIKLVNLKVHHIQNNTNSSAGGAQGLAVYGGDPEMALSNLSIDSCEIYSCILGQSESLTINGNVDGFLIADNVVHDNDNIGIVCIGWEGTAGLIDTNSDPEFVGGHHPNDRARNGIVRNNLVYNCSTEKPIKNPTYPDNDFSAGGIYIDGGKDIVIEHNKIYHCDIGIEIASEHGGVDDNNNQRNTCGIICRNNLVYYCGQYGIGIGGYDKERGDATGCKILHNTIFKCSSVGYGGGQIYINKAHHNLISGNILVARDIADVEDYDGFNNSGHDWEYDHGLVLGSSLDSIYNHDNILDSNLYYTASGSQAIRWKWEMPDSQDPKTGFASLSAIDKNAVFGNPKFVNDTNSKANGTEDFSIKDSLSSAIDEGDATQIANLGTYDFAGKPRIYNSIPDNGAYEYHPSDQDDEEGNGGEDEGEGGDETEGEGEDKKVAMGLQFSIKASEVNLSSGGSLEEFLDWPRIIAFFINPVKNREKKAKIKVSTNIPAEDNSKTTEVKCEWNKNVCLYDKRALRAANKKGIFTRDWLKMNPINSLQCDIKVWTYLPDWTSVEGVLGKKIYLVSPEINDVEKEDGTNLDDDSVQNGRIIILKGKFFGCKPPKVWMEYLNHRNRIKKKTLNVLKVFDYHDSVGNKENSCMDTLTGDSKICVLMPKKWWRGWTAGTYDIIIDNKVGLAVFSVSTK